MVKDTFLDDGHRSQQQPKMGKRAKERHTQGSGQKRELSGASNMAKEHWGLRPCYCASLRITYVPFCHSPLLYLFLVLFKMSSIKITITVVSGICLYFKMSACTLAPLARVFHSSLKEKERDQEWESKATITNKAYLIRQCTIIL